MTKVAIFGAGQIGIAVYQILAELERESLTRPNSYAGIDAFVIDSDANNSPTMVVDVQETNIQDLAKLLMEQGATHVINALPFFLNVKVASAAIAAKCSYIDFTEDDEMADKVVKLFEGTGLNCAVKCGLAPGFINYIGHGLVSLMDTPDSLMISVGALPRTVSYNPAHPEQSYNLTWSVDGLVNEYLRPCRIKRDGIELITPALGGLTTVVLDGIEYEAAYTSGGVGSLVRDLVNVPNICYMTLRYPGHFRYARQIVQESHTFEAIRHHFLQKFPTTDDDVIVVYANAVGKINGKLVRKTYSNKFYGVNGMTGIQSTTAGSGVAMLELMLAQTVSGIITHSTVKLTDFLQTMAFRRYYNTKCTR